MTGYTDQSAGTTGYGSAQPQTTTSGTGSNAPSNTQVIKGLLCMLQAVLPLLQASDWRCCCRSQGGYLGKAQAWTGRVTNNLTGQAEQLKGKFAGHSTAVGADLCDASDLI